jgi:hypothetical protein
MTAATASPAFLMHGAREAIEAGAAHIEQQVVAIEQAVSTNPGLAFDLAKTLLESTCKGILAERKAACDDAWDLPRLLKETLGHLRLVPARLAGDKEVSDSLRKTAGGLQTVIQGICEIRNSHGFASHGKDPKFQQLDGVQALLVARASDAIVSFLFRMHRDPEDKKPAPVPSFADFAAFNDYVDEANGPVRIFDLEYRASEVLFHVDPRAYQDYLAGFEPEETEADS